MNTRRDMGQENEGLAGTTGRILHSARGYDLMAWLMMLGRELKFREKVLDLARLAPGEVVLDVGCGPGTLAIRAKRRVGPAGYVAGIDASPAMIAAATKKAKKAGVDVDFRNAVVEALPFFEARFDAVLSTLMLHHLPRPAREQCVREMRRVLKPGGRVVVVDFSASRSERRGLFDHFHRHGYVRRDQIVALLTEAGFSVTSSGAIGIRDLQFVTATV